MSATATPFLQSLETLRIVPARLMPGFELDGKFQIGRLIGMGGVGAVFQAEQLSLERQVAVKVIHPVFATVPEVIERFRREATALALVDSSRVAKVYDVGWGETPDGHLPYLAMELFEGVTVAQLLDDGPMPVERAVAVAAEALEALAAVHRAGVVHRDVKPENLFLARERGGPLRVKLIDFGLSRLVAEGHADRLTRTGFTVGTPLYMAPEQARGHPRADHRIDLYALGATLFELLTGELPGPWPGDALRHLRPGVSPSLVATIARALARDPAARHPNARSFRRELVDATL